MIIPSTKYAGQVAVDAAYPYGKARNETAPDNGTGTPWEQDLVNDLWGFQQALLRRARIAPTGSVETAIGCQHMDSLLGLFGANALNFVRRDGVVSVAVKDIVWDPVAKMWLVISLNTDTFASPRSHFLTTLSSPTQIATGSYLGGANSNGSVVLFSNGTLVRRGNIVDGFSAASTQPPTASGLRRPIYAVDSGLWHIGGNSKAWFSLDEGDNWTQATTNPAIGSGDALSKMATDGTRVMAVNDISVSDYAYTDDGVTWSTGTAPTVVQAVAYDPFSDTWILAGRDASTSPDEIKVYHSTNGGSSFSLVGNALQSGNGVDVRELGFVGGMLLLATDDQRLFASEDLGLNWSEIGVSLEGVGSNSFVRIVSSPTAPNMFFTASDSASAPWSTTLIHTLRPRIS